LDTEGLSEYRAQLLAEGIRDLEAESSAASDVAAAAAQIL